MLAPAWTWWTTVPIFAVAFLVLYLPGVAILAALRVRLWRVIATAPLVTFTLVGVGGLAAWATHLPWTPVTFVVVTLLAVAPAVALGRHRDPAALRPTRLDAHRAAATLLAAVLIVRVVIQAAGAPGNFPQNPDMIFHLDLTRWFVEHASASSLDASLGVGPATQFYPAALHGLAATICTLTGAPPIIALTCLQLVILGLAWPAALLALLGEFTRPTPCLAWLAALLATAFPIFPFRLVGYGPLWPFDAGLSLLPAWLALLVAAFRAHDGRPLSWRPLALAALTLPGLALLHAGVALTALIPSYFLLTNWAFGKGSDKLGRHRTWVRIVAAASWPAFVGLGAVAAPKAMVVSTDFPAAGYAKAMADVARLWAGGQSGPKLPGGVDLQLAASLVLWALIVAGAASLVRRGTWWPVATVLLTGLMAVQLGALGSGWARWLTWPWQNVDERLRVITGLFGVVLAAIGLDAVRRLVGDRLGRPGRIAALAASVVVAVVASLISASTSSVTLSNYYAGYPRGWLTKAEAEGLQAISAKLPDDAVVVATPWNGASYLQAIGPERVLIPTEKTSSPDIEVVAEGLAHGTTPAVCRVLDAHGARWLITGGVSAVAEPPSTYAGFDRAPDAGGFTKVLDAGPYTLFEITGCR